MLINFMALVNSALFFIFLKNNFIYHRFLR